MAEYLIQDTSLTSIADQIRTLIGTSADMTPADMSSNISQANNEVGTQENLIAQIKDLLYSAVATSATIGTATTTLSSAGTRITFTVPSRPTLYFMIPTNSSTYDLGSTAYIINVLYDGTHINNISMPNSGNWTCNTTSVTASYSGTTLTLTTSTGQFRNTSYQLVYVIQPDSWAKDTIETSSATLSADNKSISFTGLSGDPKAFAIVPTTTVAVATGNYTQNITFANSAYRLTYIAGTSSWGRTTYRVTSASNGVSKSYSNGTLTVTCTTPSFRNGVTYKLVALIPG